MYEYAFVFVLLAATGFRLPFPEEGVLLLAAYLAALSGTPWTMALFCILGIGCADSIRYTLGRRRSVLFTQFKRGKKFIATTGFFAVFMSRFFISARTVLPFMAGALRMSRFSFHLASVLGASIVSSVFVVGGAWLYTILARITTYAVPLWFGFTLAVSSALVMYATRNQINLAKQQ